MIDFVCMANEGYAHWVELCLRAIERQYPSTLTHLYDISESPQSELRARYAGRPKVDYAHFPPSQWRWPAWIDGADFDFVWPRFGLRETLKFYSRKLRQRLGVRNENWMTDKAAHLARMQRFLRIVAQKPQILRLALEATRNDLVFIDVDAILLKPIDAVFGLGFDLAVTAEAPEDVIIGPEPPQCTERPSYPYQAINIGVMFMRNSPRMGPLLDAWIAEMESVRQLSIEQTALANLIYRLAPHFYESHYRATELELPGGARASVLAVPMRLYNFTHMRRGEGFPPEVAVAHFCGGKKQRQHWEWVQGMITDELDETGQDYAVQKLSQSRKN